MSNDRRQILEMLANGKISASEAEELLDALSGQSDQSSYKASDQTDRPRPKYLRILIEPKNNSDSSEKVNIRIPLQLVRAGMKLTSVLPGQARDKINDKLKDKGININLDDLSSDSMEDILSALGEAHIDVDDKNETVKIFCE